MISKVCVYDPVIVPSHAEIVTVKVPLTVGVPEMTPDESVRPEGSAPPVRVKM
jgi:hypothetical protein